MASVTSKIGEWIDKNLESVGLTRKDFRIRFKLRGKRRYFETFSFMWWVASAVMVALGILSFYSLGICLWLLSI